MPTVPLACAGCSLKASAKTTKQVRSELNRLPGSHSPSFLFNRNVIVHNECIALKLYGFIIVKQIQDTVRVKHSQRFALMKTTQKTFRRICVDLIFSKILCFTLLQKNQK